MLIAGKDSPVGNEFAEGILLSQRNVVLTGNGMEMSAASENTQSDEEPVNTKVNTIIWNKPSSLSARTLILQAENAFGSLDETVLYFDEDLYASLAQRMDPSECSRTADEMILGYEYLTLEVLTRYEKKKLNGDKPGKLVFLIEECPNMMDAIRSPVIRSGTKNIASPLIASAAAAFTSFAENIAAAYGDAPFVNIILIRGERVGDYVSDGPLAKWLASYLDSVDDLKNKLSSKKSIQWIKPGVKSAGGFSLFH